jgi:F-type H+-transporting ATPase subunit gamma
VALKQIKNKIISTKKTGKVTKAMESVSAVKMRKSQERAFVARPYVHAALRILSKVANSEAVLRHALVAPRTEGKLLLVVVTSDKGLAGSVNSAVLKKVEQLKAAHEVFDIVAIGKKAVEFAVREKITILAEYTNVSDGVTLEDVSAITKQVTDAFLPLGVYRSVEVVYQNFLSTFEQAATKRRVLPLDPAEVHFMMQGIRPRHGKFSEVVAPTDMVIDHTLEPSAEAVFDALIPQLIQIILFHAFLESKASEHSARMVAMKNATDKSKEVVKSLTIKYNKARQAKITAEISEITAGAEAMKT